MDKLTEIEGRWEKAGDWQHTGAGNVYMKGRKDLRHRVGFTSLSLGIAELVAASPTDIAWLIAEVKRLREENESLVGQLEEANYGEDW